MTPLKVYLTRLVKERRYEDFWAYGLGVHDGTDGPLLDHPIQWMVQRMVKGQPSSSSA